MKIRDRIKELRRVPASSLRPNPKNWRTHPKEQADALRGTLAEIGFAEAVVARELPDGSLELIDGHLRAETVGDAEVPVLVLDVTEDEADKLLVTLDPLAAMATVDADALASLVATVETDSDALRQMIDDLATDAGIEVEPEIVEDDVPEPPADPLTKPGDLWLLGEHRVLCGDSTKAEDVERLMSGEKADLCFTSPPYALGKSIALSGNTTMSQTGSAYDKHEDDAGAWSELMSRWWAASMHAVAHAWLVNVQPLAGNKRDLVRWMNERVERLVDVVTWDKGHAQPPMASGVMASRYEWIIVLGDLNASRAMPLSSWRGTIQSVYAGPPQRDNEYADMHAATMPVHLPAWILGTLCDRSQSVYEPFAGTGTTLIAAEQLGRRCFGMEISPAYCDVIVKRWETLTGRKATLAT